MKKLLSIMALFVISLLAVSMVSAVSEESTLGSLPDGAITVEVNDEENYGFLVVEEGEELKVEVKLWNGILANLVDGVDNDSDGLVDEADEAAFGADEAKNIEVEARLMGYDKEDTKDTKIVESLKAGTTKKVTLNVEVPKDFENGPNAVLSVRVSGGSDQLYQDYNLYVESPSHSVKIVDVEFSPGPTVKAGRSLLTTVLVENVGEKDEENVKVTVAIPELGISTVEYIDELEAGDSEDVNGNTEDVPEMFLSIPVTAEEGDYDVVVTVKYEDLEESVTETRTIHVLANQEFANQNKVTVLAVYPESQTVNAGQTARYAVALTNAGSASRYYTVEAVTGDWAVATVSELMVVLEPGENKIVYVDVAVAQDAAAGEHTVPLIVKSGSETLKTVDLKANVVGAPAPAGDVRGESGLSLRNGLEIALVVLVVLLVILGLIIGFSRLRKDDEEEQTYY